MTGDVLTVLVPKPNVVLKGTPNSDVMISEFGTARQG